MNPAPQLDPEALNELKKGKNLLAFSGGVDSSALFFLLKAASISFDMAIVDYNRRDASKEEVAYAKELAGTHNKELFVRDVTLGDSNFEANARKVRYDFFAELCQKYGYTHLITAHQLNDLTEWFFMQFTKGAGLVELIGMETTRKETAYTLVRPLLSTSRDELLEFLRANGLRYFEDASNSDPSYTRNRFRYAFVNDLIKEHKGGILKSFHYLHKDIKRLYTSPERTTLGRLQLIKRDKESQDIRSIDTVLKEMGYLLSAAQKEEILRTKDCVIGGEIAVAFGDAVIYIAPFIETVIPKAIRETYRLVRAPKKIRGYLYEAGITPDSLQSALKTILN